MTNPAWQAFAAQLKKELVWAQVLIQRTDQGFELRHVTDRDTESAALRKLEVAEVEHLAQFTVTGAFRPLSTSPNLQAGWRLALRSEPELEQALNALYPGSIADWHAAQAPNPPVTHYREFTNRQTGMYRITQMLTDPQAALVVDAGCEAGVCLKQRLWTVTGLKADPQSVKSLIPCLEPCAVLLEFARTAMRLEQAETASPLDPKTPAINAPDSEVKEGDMGDPRNPRRLGLALRKLQNR
jgi:hypothetical protein